MQLQASKVLPCSCRVLAVFFRTRVFLPCSSEHVCSCRVLQVLPCSEEHGRSRSHFGEGPGIHAGPSAGLGLGTRRRQDLAGRSGRLGRLGRPEGRLVVRSSRLVHGLEPHAHVEPVLHVLADLRAFGEIRCLVRVRVRVRIRVRVRVRVKVRVKVRGRVRVRVRVRSQGEVVSACSCDGGQY